MKSYGLAFHLKSFLVYTFSIKFLYKRKTASIMLKAELHCHAKGDVKDPFIRYTPRELIDYCAKNKVDVLSITFHDKLLWNSNLQKYAKSKGILLIPAYEPRLEGKDILVYNVTPKDIKGIKKINDLYALKKRKKDILIVAAHPFFIKAGETNRPCDRKQPLFFIPDCESRK